MLVRCQVQWAVELPKIREPYSSGEQAQASDREIKRTVEIILEVIFQESAKPVLISRRHPRTTSGFEVYLHVGSV